MKEEEKRFGAGRRGREIVCVGGRVVYVFLKKDNTNKKQIWKLKKMEGRKLTSGIKPGLS